MIEQITSEDMLKQFVGITQAENWRNNFLSDEGSIIYKKRMISRGNFLTYIEGGKIVGYCEFWRITFEQFGRIICHEPFYTDLEDTTSGNIAYVANTWIHPEWRKGYVYKALRNRFFKENFKCDYFCGEALRKKTQPVKVFKREKLLSALFTKGEENETL